MLYDRDPDWDFWLWTLCFAGIVCTLSLKILGA